MFNAPQYGRASVKEFTFDNRMKKEEPASIRLVLVSVPKKQKPFIKTRPNSRKLAALNIAKLDELAKKEAKRAKERAKRARRRKAKKTKMKAEQSSVSQSAPAAKKPKNPQPIEKVDVTARLAKQNLQRFIAAEEAAAQEEEAMRARIETGVHALQKRFGCRRQTA